MGWNWSLLCLPSKLCLYIFYVVGITVNFNPMFFGNFMHIPMWRSDDKICQRKKWPLSWRPNRTNFYKANICNNHEMLRKKWFWKSNKNGLEIFGNIISIRGLFTFIILFVYDFFSFLIKHQIYIFIKHFFQPQLIFTCYIWANLGPGKIEWLNEYIRFDERLFSIIITFLRICVDRSMIHSSNMGEQKLNFTRLPGNSQKLNKIFSYFKQHLYGTYIFFQVISTYLF